jgi:hypothetical protein
MHKQQTYNPALSFEEFETLVDVTKQSSIKEAGTGAFPRTSNFTILHMFKNWTTSMSVDFKHVKDIVAEHQDVDYKGINP